MESEDKDCCRTRLIEDLPASEDDFGESHTSIATAMAQMIEDENEDGGKAIALTGEWGSGKSTVIELLRKQLEDSPTELFVFNTWAHEGDPLRRTFLEQLIDCLTAGAEGASTEATTNEHWQEKKDELGKRKKKEHITKTPRLTKQGKLFTFSLLAMPIGLALISNTAGYLFWFSVGLSALPLAVCIVFGIWNAWGKGEENMDGEESRCGEEREDNGDSKTDNAFLSLFFNEVETQVTSETFEGPDPTSVEFAKIFRELMEDTIGNDTCDRGKQLVIVLDNLDRVSPPDALRIWSTLRVFFEYRHKTSSLQNQEWLKKLWLLVPFDPKGLDRLWSFESYRNALPGENKDEKDSSGDEPKRMAAKEESNQSEPFLSVADAFTDKTFQVKFHVPFPVLSNWRKFLIKQLEIAFPDHKPASKEKAVPEDFHAIYRIFCLRYLTGNEMPTPRNIKLFVNRLGAIHRLKGDSIPLTTQALYVALENTTEDVGALLTQENQQNTLGAVDKSYIDSDFIPDLIAIHCNVPREEALQIMCSRPLDRAISKGDAAEIADYVDSPGFWEACEEYIDQKGSRKWEKSYHILHAALVLEETADERLGSHSWNRVWDTLGQAAIRQDSWERVDKKAGKGLSILMEHANYEQEYTKTVIETLSNSEISTSADQDTEKKSSDDPMDWLSGVAKVLDAVPPCQHSTVEEEFRVPGDAHTYLTVMREALVDGENVWNGIIKFLIPSAREDDIMNELANRCSQDGEEVLDETDARIIKHLVSLKDINWQWDKLTDTLRQQLQADNSLDVQYVSGHIRALWFIKMSSNECAKKVLDELAEEGHLFHYLYETQRSNNSKGIGACLVAILSSKPAGTVRGKVGRSAKGENSYEQILSSPHNNEEEVAACAQCVADLNALPVIYEAKNAPYDTDFVSEFLDTCTGSA